MKMSECFLSIPKENGETEVVVILTSNCFGLNLSNFFHCAYAALEKRCVLAHLHYVCIEVMGNSLRVMNVQTYGQYSFISGS